MGDEEVVVVFVELERGIEHDPAELARLGVGSNLTGPGVQVKVCKDGFKRSFG